MLATLADPAVWLAAERVGWVYERKLDGLRCLAVRNGGIVELWSRNHNSFMERFPEVAAEVGGLGADDLVLDGEVVAHDGHDFVGFGGLQEHRAELTVVYCVFDLLHLLGRDITGQPLTARRRLLTRLVGEGAHVRAVGELDDRPAAELLDEACRQGWEGIIAKRPGSLYVGGRSGDWRKLKCSARQELVIAGWTEPQGARTHLGAVLVGYYEDGRLRYAGKVGTGFSAEVLADLGRRLALLERDTSPFAERVREPRAHWADPQLVAEVAFTEWTRDGRLRHPRFEGLRPDKDPASVVRERVAPV